MDAQGGQGIHKVARWREVVPPEAEARRRRGRRWRRRRRAETCWWPEGGGDAEGRGDLEEGEVGHEMDAEE